MFIGHLVIEKLLKTYYVIINKDYPPLLHDLRRIGEKSGIVFNGTKLTMIETIS